MKQEWLRPASTDVHSLDIKCEKVVEKKYSSK
jgi:hypothetical protein